MQKQNKAFNREKQCGGVDATREQTFTARSLLEELEPLLKEYFYGEFYLEGNAITVKLPNGQTFQITAK